MIFRTTDGEFIEINKADFNYETDYNIALMEAYGVKKPSFGVKSSINQVDMIYGIILRQQQTPQIPQSRL
jgi:hypothetical protein